LVATHTIKYVVSTKNSITTGAFDIILMDMSLPNIDGYETTREIRKKDKNIPIISYTANAEEGDHKKAMDAGCSEYLEKPAERLTLLKTIAGHLFNNNS